MIEYISIMKQNGTLLYSKNNNQANIDESVLTGFFAAVTHFSKEALQTYIETINLGSEKKIIISVASYEKLVACAIVNKEDNTELIQSILEGFLLKFASQFGPHFQINPQMLQKFDGTIEEELRKKSKTYDFKKKFTSWLKLLLIGYVMFMISSTFSNIASDTIGSYSQNLLYIAFIIVGTVNLFILYPLPLFFNGFNTGNRKSALINAFIYMLYIQYLFIGSSGIFEIILGYFPISLIVGFTSSLLGVYLAQRKFLWDIPKK